MSIIKKVGIASIVSILSLFTFFIVFNAAVVIGSNDSRLPDDAEIHEVYSNDATGVEVLSYKGLQTDGVSFLGAKITPVAYVNMLTDNRKVYVDSEHAEAYKYGVYLNKPVYNYIYKHEYAHLLQKEMIAKKSGGYPSLFDPWTSFKYYKNYLKLNHELKEAMPKLKEDQGSLFLTRGFETAADCYAQPDNSQRGDILQYEPNYLENSYCTKQQVKLAQTLENTGNWFTVEQNF